MRTLSLCLLSILMVCVLPRPSLGAWVWVEGEKPLRSSMHRHPWWYDKVRKDLLSGGDLISNFADQPGEAEYAVDAPQAGDYVFWLRANPLQARLSFDLNGAGWKQVDFQREPIDTVNIAQDGKPDLRFMTWIKVGSFPLKQGANRIAFRMDSANHNCGQIDCFLFTNEPFHPRGVLKPSEMAKDLERLAQANQGFIPFAPQDDLFGSACTLDLRYLNEKTAGDGGFIAAKDSHFIHSKTGQPVRFWAVNGSGNATDFPTLQRNARLLAKHGVNLIRVHGGYFDANGNVDMLKVKLALDIVEAMKAEGIYTYFSIYFPLWLQPKPGTPWLQGYDGKTHPFASLYFNRDFQKRYQDWWTALLTTPSPRSGLKITDEPAVAGLELVNEDSYFFWTFSDKIPDPQLRIVEEIFGQWLKTKYGSLEAALNAWHGQKTRRDNLAEGRMGFRPLWNMFNERSPRDKDTAAFLTEHQRAFYVEQAAFVRKMGFKGVVCCSNWTTASAEYFGPLEKFTYTAGDFIDRHGYFECHHKGDNAGWSVRAGHTFADRSALRFDPEEPGKPRLFNNSIMDIKYDGKPSMISETTFCRPNRYRSEAPLYYAAYAALQDSDCIVHFAFDSGAWTVKPGFFMQPWTLMSPAMMGQFPAAAVIYRQGLISAGQQMLTLNLRPQDLFDLKGTPLPQDANLDELRLKDVPLDSQIRPHGVIDPLIHYVGPTRVNFTADGASSKLADLSAYINRAAQSVTSSTRELKLDYGKGILTINAPAAQGICGNLRAAGSADLKNLSIASDLEVGAIVAVSLDGAPLATSGKILLQVMSEERNSDFQTLPAGADQKIVNLGRDPWLIRQITGQVTLKRPDAASLKVTALDYNGYATKTAVTAPIIKLDPKTIYYLISK